MRHLIARRKALIAAGGVLTFGFGVMNAFWFLTRNPQNLPGHWDYRAPIVGDGLLLPIAAGVLVAAMESLPAATRERQIAIVAGLLGGAVGMYSQIAWLRDPAPLAN